jgi:hypothetical protein
MAFSVELEMEMMDEVVADCEFGSVVWLQF